MSGVPHTTPDAQIYSSLLHLNPALRNAMADNVCQVFLTHKASTFGCCILSWPLSHRPAARAGRLLQGSVSNSSPGPGLYLLLSPVVAGAKEPGTVSCCGPCSGRESPSPAAACADRGRDHANDRDKVRDHIRTESGRAQPKWERGPYSSLDLTNFPTVLTILDKLRNDNLRASTFYHWSASLCTTCGNYH